MDVPRSEQEIQEERTKLGIVWTASLLELLLLCRGRVSEEQGAWFYELFLDDRYTGVPKTIQGVRERLSSAWWIEEADIRQQICLLIHRKKFHLGTHPHHLETLRMSLGRCLRDWLLSQRVFSRQIGWEQDYSYLQEHSYIPQKELGFSLLFENSAYFDIFEKYLLYMTIILGLPQNEMSDILLTNTMQVNRFQQALRSKLEEINARTTPSG